LECKIYFAYSWSAKFILRILGVQNLFCGLLGVHCYFAVISNQRKSGQSVQSAFYQLESGQGI